MSKVNKPDWAERLQRSRKRQYEKGWADCEQRLIEWIKENRSAIELEPGEYIYRDHFDSESLIEFIKGENK